jgi:hypothetical protein
MVIEAVCKLLYLALRNIAKKWTMPVHAWKDALNRFVIHPRDPAAGQLSARLIDECTNHTSVTPVISDTTCATAGPSAAVLSAC